MSKGNSDIIQAKKQQPNNYDESPPQAITPGAGARQSRKSRKTGVDIIKELEDYVKDKKTNTNKFLDDISEYDPKPPKDNKKKYMD